MRCENNDRLVTMHTSDPCRYKNQRLHCFHQSARLFTEEDEEEEEEYDDEIRDSRMSVFSCGETKVRMVP